MTTLLQLIRNLFGAFRLWIIVMPWEKSVRVRLGRWVCLLGPGIHLRIPFADATFTQSVRTRMLHLPTQTVATKDGKTVTLGAAVAFTITDVHRLYNTLHDAASTIQNLCQCAIADAVLSLNSRECFPKTIGALATKAVSFHKYGLGEPAIGVTDFAFVKTFRLISDQRWSVGGTPLDTSGVQPGDAPR